MAHLSEYIAYESPLNEQTRQEMAPLLQFLITLAYNINDGHNDNSTGYNCDNTSTNTGY